MEEDCHMVNTMCFTISTLQHGGWVFSNKSYNADDDKLEAPASVTHQSTKSVCGKKLERLWKGWSMPNDYVVCDREKDYYTWWSVNHHHHQHPQHYCNSRAAWCKASLATTLVGPFVSWSPTLSDFHSFGVSGPLQSVIDQYLIEEGAYWAQTYST